MIIVRSVRGETTQVDSFLPVTVRQIAMHAAQGLGYRIDGDSLFSLAGPGGVVLGYDDPAPTSGEWVLVETGRVV